MPAWLTIVGGVLKAIGLVDAAEHLFERWQAQQAGKAQQVAADNAAAVKDDRDAQKIDADVAGMSDDQLNSELRGLRDPKSGS